MARGPYTDEQIDAAIDAISDPEAFRDTERQVARAAPRLQRILAEALGRRRLVRRVPRRRGAEGGDHAG